MTELRYDGRSLPPMIEGEPLDKMNRKETPKIPLLTGVTKDETKNAINGNFFLLLDNIKLHVTGIK